jgi:hypothetical protein
MDTEQFLNDNAGFAQAFKPMSQSRQARLLERTREKGLTGKFEPFKTPPNFDGPVGRKLHGVS